VAKARRHFAQSAADYDALRRRGFASVALFRNLGNALLLANDLPRALLAYRAGLELDPDDRALNDLLQSARDLVPRRPEDTAAWSRPVERPPWMALIRPGWLFPTIAIGYAAAWLGLVRWRMTRRPAPAVVAVLSAAVVAICAMLFQTELRRRADLQAYPIVVLADDGVLLRKGDALTFPPRSTAPLDRGVEVRLLFRKGDWLQVEQSDGTVGWVPRRYVLESLDGPIPDDSR
jgi:hypothetical protein